MPRQTIADAAARALASRRALSPEELGQLIAGAGLTRSASPTRAVSRALHDDPRFHRLADGRWVVLEHLLSGATLTHRLTDRERAGAAVALVPDLALLGTFAWRGLWLPDGTPLAFVWDAEARERTGADTDAAIHGPAGWLPGEPGTLLHVRLTGSLLRVVTGAEPRPTSRLTARRIVETIREEIDGKAGTGSGFLPPAVSLEETLLGLLVDAPDLLREPLAPLGDILSEAGLEMHRGFVGPRGSDWERLDDFLDFDAEEWGRETRTVWEGHDESGGPADGGSAIEVRTARMAEAFGLDAQDVDALKLLLGAYELSRQLGGFAGSETHARLAQLLAFPGVARVLAIYAWTEPDLEPFVQEIASAAAPMYAAGPRYVLAACAEARGDVLEAERGLRAALEVEPTHELALVGLARLETDRGRYREALRLLRAVDVPADDPQRAWLEEVVRPAFANIGRNAPCPCGSGRKYKVCHLGQAGDARSVAPARALLHKLLADFLHRASGRFLGAALLRMPFQRLLQIAL